MVEKLLRAGVAATEIEAAAFLKALNARGAERGQQRWRRSDLVAWRKPRLTADMMRMRRAGCNLSSTLSKVSIGMVANESSGRGRLRRCLLSLEEGQTFLFVTRRPSSREA
jgi:hypothetical protein